MWATLVWQWWLMGTYPPASTVTPAALQPQPLGVRDRPDGQQRVGPRRHPPVVTAHDDALLGAVTGDRPGPLQQADPPPEEVLLQHRRNLGVLGREDLLAAHDEGHRAPQRGEHVHELDTGHPRPDDHQVLGQLGGRVGVAGAEDADAVPIGPGREAGPAPGAEQDGVRLEVAGSVVGLGHHLVGSDQGARATHQVDVLAAQDAHRGLLQALLERDDAAAQAFEIEPAVDLVEAHAAGPAQVGHGAPGGDHRLGGDAVAQVGRTPDHVPLHQGDLHAEPGGVGGGLRARRSATDDHEAHGAPARSLRGGSPTGPC